MCAAPTARSSAPPPPGELEKAVQLLRAKQNAFYIQAVRDALQSEQQRKSKLLKVTTHLEGKRLEKKFAKERAREREHLQQIQEDHALLLRAKIAEWKANGVPALPDSAAATNGVDNAGSTAAKLGDHINQQPQESKKKVSKAALSRLATPRVTVQKVSVDGTGRPGTGNAGAATSQDMQFLTDVIRKQDRERLQRAVSQPVLNEQNLRAMSETDLLHTKAALLQQLHGVVSQQERLVRDDQCTVRSSVSSWKSSSASSSGGTSAAV